MLFADGDEEDDPDLVEKQCLEICNGSSKPEIVIQGEDDESSVQAKKRKAHSTSFHAIRLLKKLIK